MELKENNNTRRKFLKVLAAISGAAVLAKIIPLVSAQTQSHPESQVVFSTTTGHTHSGTDSRALAADSVGSTQLAINAVTDAKIATHASTKITGLPAQTQALNMNNNQITGLRIENVGSLPAAGQAGRMVYLTTDTNIYRDSGTAWKTLGGGGMKTRLRLGNYTGIDPTDQIGFVTNQLLIVPEDARGYNHQSVIVTNAVATHSSNKEYRGETALDFGGKPVKKVVIHIHFSVDAIWGDLTSHDIQLNATNTKIEILNGITVKATWTLGTAVKTNLTLNSGKSLTYSALVVLDLADFVFTDFRVKVYYESTVNTTTNLSNHQHRYGTLWQDEFRAGPSDADDLVEVELGT